MSSKSKFPPNPNENCLEGTRCPKCGFYEHLIIEVEAVIEGTHTTSKFWAQVFDDGTENPVVSSDVEYDEASRAHCPDCHFEGTLKEFRVLDEGE